MNSVAVALRRASERGATTRKELSNAFDEEWGEVEFQPDAEAVVLGVPQSVAWDWWLGDADDLALCLSVCDPPEVIFMAAMPRHDEVKSTLKKVVDLHRQGASKIVFQTRNPVILAHARRMQFRFHELECGNTRVLGESEPLTRWLKNLSKL